MIKDKLSIMQIKIFGELVWILLVCYNQSCDLIKVPKVLKIRVRVNDIKTDCCLSKLPNDKVI